MKKITNLRNLAFWSLLIGISVSLSAQQGRGKGMRGESPSPENINRHVEQMAADLQLNEKQKARVLDLERSHLETMEKARAERGGDREAHQQVMEQHRKDHEARMKEVLTEDQFNRWKENRQQQYRERRHDGKGKGQGYRGNVSRNSSRP
ncbi:MAG: hypothetical protein IH599_03250 [Bacteroidales bacterium]|nr:hypothetical protein [Bacteroidales bacterium]